MFRHVVMFEWAEGLDHEQVRTIGAGLDALPAAIPEIAGYHHGPDAGLADTNYDYVVVGDFADVDGYLAYRDHPVHRRLVEEQIAPHVAARAAVQYAIEP